MPASATIVTHDGRVVCANCIVAERPWSRMRGLLGREPPVAEGILLQPASAVHTWFMRSPIDVVFLDRELRVLAISARLPPWRMARHRGARAVLEVAAGRCAEASVDLGDALALVDG